MTEGPPEQFEDAARAFCEATGDEFEEFWTSFLVVWEMVKPPMRSMSDPAACTADSSRLATNPRIRPAPTCRNTAPMRSGVLIEASGTWGASWGATAIASTAESPIFTCTGIMRLLNGGAMATHELARTSASRKATRMPGAKLMVTGGSR